MRVGDDHASYHPDVTSQCVDAQMPDVTADDVDARGGRGRQAWGRCHDGGEEGEEEGGGSLCFWVGIIGYNRECYFKAIIAFTRSGLYGTAPI